MGDFDQSKATTTDFTSAVPDFIVKTKALDAANPNQDETFWYFEKATQNFGYYLGIPEIFSAANGVATWGFGRGWKANNALLEQDLLHVSGQGQDTFDSIVWNMQVTKLVVGDAFCEIIKQGKVIINMIPISPERVRLVFSKDGLLERYDSWNGKKWVKIDKENMWHLSNKRIGDNMHGQSQIEPAKFIIDARNEALADERTIKHRDKALGIAYYKTNNTGKITFANTQIETAVNKGEMLAIPETTVKIEPWPSRSSEDRQSWIAYLENFFYQVFGIPRSIATSEGTSEVGGINGHLIFEPIYVKEQRDAETTLWRQHGIEVSFTKPPSLAPKVQADAEKNTGQVQIQEGEVEPTLNR